MNLNVIDLFCGAGGLSKGFEMAGFNILMGIDYVDTFVKTFSENHKTAKVICGDIRKISVDEIKEKIGNKKVHVIIGGPPCQSFSMAGRRDPNDPRDSLFMEFIRIVKGLSPDYFVMENVNGIKSKKLKNGKKAIDVIMFEFKKIGYNVKFKTLLAADYGIPQKRRRVIFIGTKHKNENIDYPQPTHSNKPYLKLDGSKVKPWVPVRNVLLDKSEVDNSFFHSQKMIDGFIERKKRNKEKGYGFGAQYLKLNEPSFTISARYWKDGADALVKYSDKEIRMLTPLECARIQSFPDNFKFIGSKREIYTQIGNAVPPLLGKAIAEHLKKKLLR